MKDRGKSLVFSDNYYSSSSDLPCRKHPSSSSSSVGICAYCLKDRLIKLVCSDCGEQRLSSCSCSDISSSYPNSCIVDVGSVGRISFLLESEKEDIIPHSINTKPTVFLKRSSSTSTDVKRGSAFWKFGRLFRKKREKDLGFSVCGGDEKGERGSFDNMGISRCRSVAGFTSGFDDFIKDGQSETEQKRKGGFNDFNGRFICDDDSGFIDIKFGFSESKPEFSSLRSSEFLESESSGFRVSKDGESHSVEYLTQDSMFSSGSSCRISVDDRDIKKCKKKFKVWKWILKHHSSGSGRRPSLQKDDEHVSIDFGSQGLQIV